MLTKIYKKYILNLSIVKQTGQVNIFTPPTEKVALAGSN